jgi:hypothetical protein
MNTLMDRFEFNREYASRHIGKSDRRWWAAGIAVAAMFLAWLVWAGVASTVPSMTYALGR